jgi:hypothetical protein
VDKLQVIEMDRILGWKKDKYSNKDFLHLTNLNIPDTVTLNPVSIRDQGQLGSCVGFGIGANLTSKYRVEWFSPTWIYNGARFIEGTLTEDAGCEPRDALDWLVEKGCLLEHLWKYVDVLDTRVPPSNFEQEAVKFPLATYYRIVDGIDGICSAIADGKFVSIGTPWFDKWMNIKVDGILPEVTKSDDVVGGHETCLYGYDKIKKVFVGMNSWSTAWGRVGHYTMQFSSFDVFKELGGYDTHYLSLRIPTPIVSKSKCFGSSLLRRIFEWYNLHKHLSKEEQAIEDEAIQERYGW